MKSINKKKKTELQRKVEPQFSYDGEKMTIYLKIYKQSCLRLFKKIIIDSNIPSEIVKNIGSLENVFQCLKNSKNSSHEINDQKGIIKLRKQIQKQEIREAQIILEEVEETQIEYIVFQMKHMRKQIQEIKKQKNEGKQDSLQRQEKQFLSNHALQQINVSQIRPEQTISRSEWDHEIQKFVISIEQIRTQIMKESQDMINRTKLEFQDEYRNAIQQSQTRYERYFKNFRLELIKINQKYDESLDKHTESNKKQMKKLQKKVQEIVKNSNSSAIEEDFSKKVFIKIKADQMEFKEKFKNIKEEILQYVENNVKKQNEWVQTLLKDYKKREKQRQRPVIKRELKKREGMIKEEEVEEEEEKLQRKQEDSKIAERKDVVLINPQFYSTQIYHDMQVWKQSFEDKKKLLSENAQRQVGQIKQGHEGTYIVVSEEVTFYQRKKSKIQFYENEDRFEGQEVNNKKSGKGIYFYSTGAKYEGEYQNGKQHGKGIYHYPNGSIFVGEYHEGKKNGKGRKYNTDGTYRNQEWQNDRLLS